MLQREDFQYPVVLVQIKMLAQVVRPVDFDAAVSLELDDREVVGKNEIEHPLTQVPEHSRLWELL